MPVIFDIANIIKSLSTNDNRGGDSNTVRAHQAIKRSVQQLIGEPLRSAAKPGKRNKRSTVPVKSAAAAISIVQNIPTKNATKLVRSQSNDLNNEVHVTLPSVSNLTLTLDEYEDLALDGLNGTEAQDNRPTSFNSSIPFGIGNGTAPEAAMLISGRIRYPVGNKVGPGKQRPCELFGSICLRVEDYPM